MKTTSTHNAKDRIPKMTYTYVPRKRRDRRRPRSRWKDHFNF